MSITQLLSGLHKKNSQPDLSTTWLGVEQIGKSIFLVYRIGTDNQSTFRLAKSIDGLNFQYIKTIVDKYTPPSFNPTFSRLLPDCTIEGLVKISRGNLVVFHQLNDLGQIEIGVALIKNQKIIFRSETPLWTIPEEWQNHHPKFIGLAHHGVQIIGYWQLNNNDLQAVIYPGYKRRNPETVKNIDISLRKHHTNPIISPRSQHRWESAQTFNPGVVMLGDKFHFLYRAIGHDGVSRLGYATSVDGTNIDFRSDFPVFSHHLRSKKIKIDKILTASGGSWGGVEDPRLVRVGQEDVVYMTYTAVDGELRIGFSSIKIEDLENGIWNWRPPVCISVPGHSEKNWVIFPEKINGKYAVLHGITPKISIEYLDNLDFNGSKFIYSRVDPQAIVSQNSTWDKRLRGCGSPPIKTDRGWLIFYHSMNYKVGVMLLDLYDPTKIICRAKTPVLESAEFYEKTGFKPDIVFVCGACVKDGNLYVYYGGADNYVCVAMANLNEFLDALTYIDTPILESAKIFKITKL